MNEDLCPCCGKKPRNGLFERRPWIEMPLAAEWIRESGVAYPVEDGPFLTMFSRHFIPAQLPLPVGRPDSPIRLRIWIEIQESDVAGIRAVLLGERRSFSSVGTLACDIPGFPGSVGSFCRYRFRGHGEEAEIKSCSDQRIFSLPDDAGHQDMARIYRQIWGNDRDLPDFDPGLQEEMVGVWKNWLGRQAYAREVMPPPKLAGMNPGRVIVAPPLDTNEPAVLATSGCSDLPGVDNKFYELTCYVNNPSEDFIACFGEFAYLTRMNQSPIGPTSIVPENSGVPDTDEMIAWMLAEPWWENYAPEEEVGGRLIDYLVAVPLYAAEVAYAAVHGPSALARVFRDIDPDLSSLQRQPVVLEGRDG